MNQILRPDELSRSDPIGIHGEMSDKQNRTRRERRRAVTRAAHGAKGNVQALARLSWPQAPLTLMASDFADLESGKPAQVLRSLVELCRSIGVREILILDLKFLASDQSRDTPSGHVDTRRVRMLGSIIRETCRLMNIPAPVIRFERREQSLDLRISLAAAV